MHGHVVKAVSLEFSPFLTYSQQDGVITPKDSLDWRMVTTIADILNFKVRNIRITRRNNNERKEQVFASKSKFQIKDSDTKSQIAGHR